MIGHRTTIAVLLLAAVFNNVKGRDYNIVDYGAKADTTELSTTALQRAIDDCAAAGGGRVAVCA